MQVRFDAFGEKFDLHLAPLDSFLGSTSARTRVVGENGVVLHDRPTRAFTYVGQLAHGGWVRAVVKSPGSAALHFLHKVSATPGETTIHGWHREHGCIPLVGHRLVRGYTVTEKNENIRPTP